MRWPWRPELPGFGWYLVELSVRDREEKSSEQPPIARTFGAMLWLPRPGPLHPRDAKRFSLSATGLPDAQWDLLPDIMRRVGVDHAVVSLWQRDTTLRDIEPRVEKIGGLLESVLTSGGALSLSMTPMPKALTEQEAFRKLSMQGLTPIRLRASRQRGRNRRARVSMQR